MVEQTAAANQAEVLLLYGSETGNCMQIAEDLRDELNRSGLFESAAIVKRKVQCYPLNDSLKKAKLQEKTAIKIVVFLCSSTGDGESPENSADFFRYLRRETANVVNGEDKTLSHICYTVLGLGDSNYSKYQGAPRYLDARLKILGATPFKERTEADDATNLGLVIEPWLETIGEELAAQVTKAKQYSAPERLALLQVNPIVSTEVAKAMTQPEEEATELTTKTFTGTLTMIVPLVSCDDKEIFEAVIEFPRKLTAQLVDAGSTIGVFPHNLPCEIDTVISAFGWRSDELLGNLTVREHLTTEIDIRTRRSGAWKTLAQADNFAAIKATLETIFTQDARLTLFELARTLNEKSIRAELPSYLLDGDFQKVSKRFYSILNDPFGTTIAEANTLKLLFSRHTFKDSHGEKVLPGHCTQFLADEALGKRITCQIGLVGRVLRLPTTAKSILIVCQGTGVAPMISILEKALRLNSTCDVTMVFGVRDNSTHMLYREFLESFFCSREGSRLIVACSRDIDQGKCHESDKITYKRGYVQDCLKELDVSQGASDDLCILICGNKKALGSSVIQSIDLSPEKVAEMRDQNRILMELWDE